MPFRNTEKNNSEKHVFSLAKKLDHFIVNYTGKFNMISIEFIELNASMQKLSLQLL